MTRNGKGELRPARHGIASWIDVFAAAAACAAAEAERFAEQIEARGRSWREQVGTIRAGSTAERLLSILTSAPIITVATAARLTERSIQAANLAVERLVRAGVLVQSRAAKRNRPFEAVGLLDEITLFERALASPRGDTRTSPPARPVPSRPQNRSPAPRVGDTIEWQ